MRVSTKSHAGGQSIMYLRTAYQESIGNNVKPDTHIARLIG